jgi:hypothetical protein
MHMSGLYAVQERNERDCSPEMNTFNSGDMWTKRPVIYKLIGINV